MGDQLYVIAVLVDAYSKLYEVIFEEQHVRIQWVQDIPHSTLTDVAVVELQERYEELYIAFSSSSGCDDMTSTCSRASPLYRFENGILWFCCYVDAHNAVSVTGWESNGRLNLLFASFVDRASDKSDLFFYVMADDEGCRLNLRSIIRKIKGANLYGMRMEEKKIGQSQIYKDLFQVSAVCRTSSESATHTYPWQSRPPEKTE